MRKKTYPQELIDKPLDWLFEFIDLLPLAVYRTTIEGELLFCNRALARILGLHHKRELVGCRVIDFYHKINDRVEFVKAVMDSGYVEGTCLRLKKSDGSSIQCEVTVNGVSGEDGDLMFLDGTLKVVSEKIKGNDMAAQGEHQKEILTRERFQGVLEMAGGVAHRLNQPLTIINNLLNEALLNWKTDERNYQKILKVHSQVTNLNEIAKKIRGIKKYEAMDYVGGIKIVDIDKASLDNDRVTRGTK